MSRIFFTCLALLLHSSLYCMENQSLLDTNSQSDKPSSLIPGPHTYQSFPAPKQFADRLQQHHPNDQLLLTPETRAEHIALIRSIGARNTATKLLTFASLLFSANAAKDILSLALWGLQPLSPLTNVIPPSHLAPLQPCYQACYRAGCCHPYCGAGECMTICDGPWICTFDTSSPRLTNLGTTNLVTCGLNIVGALSTGLFAYHNYHKGRDAEKKLTSLLAELDAMTNDQTIPPQNPQTALMQEFSVADSSK